MGALACMELVRRRLQRSTEACAHVADAPNRVRVVSAEAELENLRASSLGRWCSPPVAMTSLVGEGRPFVWLPQNEGPRGKRSDGIFLLPSFEIFPRAFGGQRRRLLRDVNCACRGLSWMHGDENLPAARPLSLVEVFVWTCNSASSWRLYVGWRLTAPSMRMRLSPSV